jgi:hypothetical protein
MEGGPSDTWYSEQAERALTTARKGLSPEEFAAARNGGRLMSAEGALACATMRREPGALTWQGSRQRERNRTEPSPESTAS